MSLWQTTQTRLPPSRRIAPHAGHKYFAPASTARHATPFRINRYPYRTRPKFDQTEFNYLLSAAPNGNGGASGLDGEMRLEPWIFV